MYDPKSKVASEFICHEEIEENTCLCARAQTQSRIHSKGTEKS